MREEGTLYIVIAIHDTGHGPDVAPVMLTDNVQTAHETAMSAEKNGYEFHSDESGVRIYRLEAGRSLRKADFKTDESPLVFHRTWDRRREGWRADWCDDEARLEFEARVAGRHGYRYDC